MIRNISQVEKIFKEELTRLQTDYIDYYLMHMMTDIANWENLKKIEIEDWIADKKESGQIRQVGFSFHGDSSMFLKILNAYDWDFCQIQYNYLDENTQAGRIGLEAAEKKGIPVIIMEPLRGGKLVNSIPSDVLEKMAQNPRHWSAAQWAFNWLWNQSGVTCVLSGMNSVDMVEENIKSASEADCGFLTAEDNAFYDELKVSILKTQKVGCTGCSYCMPCPHGVDIPQTFTCYNMMYTNKKRTGRIYYMQTVGLRKNPGFASRCKKCGKCELHCPQKIQIRSELENAGRELRPFFYRIVGSIARMFMHLNRSR